MMKIKVNTHIKYDILIEKGLIRSLGKLVKEAIDTNSNTRVVIITDYNVERYHLDKVLISLRKQFINVEVIKVAPGEVSKSIDTFAKVLNALAEMNITRDDLIIAFGGGVVGDLSGFVASSYLRGIKYIQVPTTVLSCVDSSVGGKTAINLKAGKNLAGAFYQPSLVVIDTELLETLPEREIKSGFAEIIKYGVIRDEMLFEDINPRSMNNIGQIIARCVTIKRNVVSNDEYDKGERQVLNFGHSIGHAIEALSDFKVSHGEGVATGMIMMTRAAYKLGYCNHYVYQDMLNKIREFGYPDNVDYTADEIISFMIKDKKRSGECIKLIVPREIGTCVIEKFQLEDLKEVVRYALSEV